jgi:hypothetical protein
MNVSNLRALAYRLDKNLPSTFFLEYDGNVKSKSSLCAAIADRIKRDLKNYTEIRKNNNSIIDKIPLLGIFRGPLRQYNNQHPHLTYEEE